MLLVEKRVIMGLEVSLTTSTSHRLVWQSLYCIHTTDKQSAQGKPFVILEPTSWTVSQRAWFPFLQSSKSCLFRLFHGILLSKALLYQDQERLLPKYAGIIWYQRLLNYSEVEAYLCEWHYIVLCFAPSSPFPVFGNGGVPTYLRKQRLLRLFFFTSPLNCSQQVGWRRTDETRLKATVVLWHLWRIWCPWYRWLSYPIFH